MSRARVITVLANAPRWNAFNAPDELQRRCCGSAAVRLLSRDSGLEQFQSRCGFNGWSVLPAPAEVSAAFWAADTGCPRRQQMRSSAAAGNARGIEPAGRGDVHEQADERPRIRGPPGARGSRRGRRDGSHGSGHRHGHGRRKPDTSAARSGRARSGHGRRDRGRAMAARGVAARGVAPASAACSAATAAPRHGGGTGGHQVQNKQRSQHGEREQQAEQRQDETLPAAERSRRHRRDSWLTPGGRFRHHAHRLVRGPIHRQPILREPD